MCVTTLFGTAEELVLNTHVRILIRVVCAHQTRLAVVVTETRLAAFSQGRGFCTEASVLIAHTALLPLAGVHGAACIRAN